MNSVLTERIKFLKGLAPSADVAAGGTNSDIVNMKGYRRCAFIASVNSASTGVATFTVQACSDASATATSAIAFKHRKLGTGADETMSALTAVASTGVACVAGADEVHIVEIEAADLPDGYAFVRLALAETVDAAIVGSVLVALYDPSYTSDQPDVTGLS